MTRHGGNGDMHPTRTHSTALFILLLAAFNSIPTPARAQTRASSDASSIEPLHRRVVVSLPDRTLSLFENGEVVRVFPVAVGAPHTPTPVGTFTIKNRIPNPTYYRPGKVIGPGPSNPLGTRWMGLDLKGYGIHGTDEPQSIGHARSHGCVRLRNDDVEQLFELLRPGDIVELRNDLVMTDTKESR
jgi:lipoprotein-anchoring transpeptidase ErfK/SrfK